MRCSGVALALAAALSVASCAAAPNSAPRANVSTLGVEQRDGNSRTVDLRHEPGVGQATIPGSLNAVWGVLPAVFEQLEIEVSLLDASAAAIGNRGYRARRVDGQRMSRWLDCGRNNVRANADEYDVTLTVIVQVVGATDEGTTLRTTVDAYARDRSQGAGSVHCLSMGTLERRIPEVVMERLAS
jgi:hypothetical protein